MARKSKPEVKYDNHISLCIVMITDFVNVDFQVYVLLQCETCVCEFTMRCKQDLNTQQTHFVTEFQNTSYYLLLLAFIYKREN
jgi:hypothetical protein